MRFPLPSLSRRTAIRLAPWAGAVAATLLLAAVGCQPPLDNVIKNSDGQSIRLTAISSIVGDSSLTDAEKRQGLQDLGITDQDLINVLLSGG
jgi:hypothetical protein